MTDVLDDESRRALVKYRMQRSEESLLEAELMAREEHYNAAMNRLYYACYYAVVAILLNNNYSASTHSGVKTLFSLHFIATGFLPAELGKTLSRLFEIRHSGDYDDFVFCDRDLYEEYAVKARCFVQTIQTTLK